MNVWLPDMPGAASVGELPSGVRCRCYSVADGPPQEARDAEFFVPGYAPIAALATRLQEMADLRVIQTLSAGVDAVAAHVPPGVTLCNARGAHNSAVAEWIAAVMLAHTKALPQLLEQQRERRWRQRQLGDLEGLTVTILGYGSIGATLERALAGFGVRLIRVGRTAEGDVHGIDELASLLPVTDVLVVLLPLTDETRGLLGRDLLGRLPAGALLVNAARGPVVDTDALLELLAGGRLHAALDVTDPEPLAPEHPLWSAPGVLITPHVAGDTAGSERRAFALVGEQVRRWAAGEALRNVVAPEQSRHSS